MTEKCRPGCHVWPKALRGACQCGEHRRCCADFFNRATGRSRQCAKRSVENSAFCERHQWVGESIRDINRAALDSLNRPEQTEDYDS